MRRRQFLTLLGGAAAMFAPRVVRAQQAPAPVIGVLQPGTGSATANVAAMLKGLAEHGFVEGRSLTIKYRWGEGQFDRLPALAADLVRAPVAAIIAIGTANTAQAAMAATTNIPIVFLNGSDPVKQGLVASINRPGGNVTGVTFLSGPLGAKRLELLHELVPHAGLVGFLVNPKNARVEADTAVMQAAARSLGTQIVVASASSQDEITTAFAAIAERKAEAVIVNGDGLLNGSRGQLAALAARYRLPASYPGREYAEAGGLMSYGDDRLESFRQVGRYAGRILKGEKPADLPVLQPSRFELVINLKTAKALGLEIPAKVLALADEVIE